MATGYLIPPRAMKGRGVLFRGVLCVRLLVYETLRSGAGFCSEQLCMDRSPILDTLLLLLVFLFHCCSQ